MSELLRGFDEAEVAEMAAEASSNGHSEAEPEYFGRMPLDVMMASGIPKPKILNGLLYSGKLHSLAGPPESGKTVLSLYLALQVMKQGSNVLLWDEEAGPAQTASILLALGAKPEMIRDRFYYMPFPGTPWSPRDKLELDTLIGKIKPRLSIWDSSAAMMGVAGVDENHPGEVTRFWNTVYGPVARKYGCAVLVTDHDAKGNPESRYARGSGAKLAGVDVGIKLYALRPFTRSQDGVLALEVTKDRGGFLHRHYRIRVTHDPLELQFIKSTAKERTDDSLPPAQEKLLAVMTYTPMSIPQLVDRVVDEYGHGLRRETCSKALTDLLNSQMVDRLDLGAGRAVLWVRKGGSLEEEVAKEGAGEGPAEEAAPEEGWPEGSAGAAVQGTL